MPTGTPANIFGDDWTGAFDFLKKKLVELDEYVDQHNLYGDLQHINDKYTPGAMKSHVAEALETIDEQLSYWAAKAADTDDQTDDQADNGEAGGPDVPAAAAAAAKTKTTRR